MYCSFHFMKGRIRKIEMKKYVVSKNISDERHSSHHPHIRSQTILAMTQRRAMARQGRLCSVSYAINSSPDITKRLTARTQGGLQRMEKQTLMREFTKCCFNICGRLSRTLRLTIHYKLI